MRLIPATSTPYPKIVFSEIEKEINTAIGMGEKDALQGDDVDVFQFAEQLKS